MNQQYIKRMKPLLGTFIEIGLLENEQNNTQFEIGFQAIEQIEQQMSFHNSNSALSLLNKSEGRWIKLPRQTVKVLSLAKKLGQESNDLFNCTLGGYLVNNNKLPNHFTHRFSLVGQSSQIQIIHNQVRLLEPVLITLDGIAKGYAIDLALEKLKSQGVQSAWINAGGDIRVIGEITLSIHQRDIEQANAFNPKNTFINLKNCALATSQISRKKSGDIPSHIVNNLGVQAEDGLISVTSEKAWLADGLTKVLALLPENKRPQMAHKFSAEYHRLRT